MHYIAYDTNLTYTELHLVNFTLASDFFIHHLSPEFTCIYVAHASRASHTHDLSGERINYTSQYILF